MKKILVAGGTGFVGKHLISFLSEKGYFLNVLTRKQFSNTNGNIHYYQWDIENQMIDQNAFDGVDTIINLTGANIGEKRWTSKRKKVLLESRIQSINLLYKYVAAHNYSINTFISSSAVGYYGAITTDNIFDETSENANDFLGFVCKKWEDAAMQFQASGIRTVILRKGVILGKDGGMYKKLVPLAKLGINVSLGSGKQYLPWIDMHDLVRIYDFVLNNLQVNGIYNTVSSNHITMNDFSKTMLQALGKQSFLPNVPSFLIRIVFGEMAVMLLEGSKVGNEKLKNTGFTFDFDSLKMALNRFL